MKLGKPALPFREYLVLFAPALPVSMVLLAAQQWGGFMLFHTLMELLASATGIALFVVGWYTFQPARNDFLLFLAIAYLWVTALDALHAFGLAGMPLLPSVGANATQNLWGLTRLWEGVAFLAAPWFLSRPLPRATVLLGFGALAAITFDFALSLHALPLVDEANRATWANRLLGLMIGLVQAAGVLFLLRLRPRIDDRAFLPLLGALLSAFIAQASFLGLPDTEDTANHIGHLAKLLGIWLVFIAILRVNLRAPLAEFAELRTAQQALLEHQIQLQQVIDATGSYLWQATPDGTYTYVGERAAQVKGYASEQLLGRRLYDFMPAEDRETARRALEQALAEGASFAFAHRNVTADGRLLWEEAKGMAFSDLPGGEPTGLRGIGVGITHTKLAESELQAAKEEADRANRAKGELLANISHEMRTPLHGVLGFTELVRREGLSPDQLHAVEMVRRSADTLLKLIDNLLELAQMGRYHQETDLIPFDMEAVVFELCDAVRIETGGRPVELLVDLVGTPSRVVGDPVRLRRLLHKLLHNAVKFTPSGHVLLRSRPLEYLGEELWVEWLVRDTGIGIPLEKQSTVFDGFTQADGSITRRYGGAGLGLTIARNLVRQMGGRIELRSTPGEGSEFRVQLPLRLAPGAELGVSPLPAFPGRRVLVVDDNPAAAEILAGDAAALEMETRAIRTVDEIIPALRAAHYDLLLIDLGLPGLELAELQARLTAEFESPPPLLPVLPGPWKNSPLGLLGDSLPSLTKPVRRGAFVDAAVRLFAGGSLVSRQRAAAPSLLPRRRLLVVEDNEMSREFAQRMLSRLGQQVVLAENGREAVEMALAEPFDLILMDVQMPVLGGLDATRELRAAGLRTPIVAVTANATPDDREACLAAGMDDFIAKPVGQAELVAMLARYLGTNRPTPIPSPSVEVAEPWPTPERLQRKLPFDQAEIEQLLVQFAHNSHERLPRLRGHCAAGRFDEAVIVAHGIKGAALNIDVQGVAKPARRLELILRGSPAEYPAPLAELEQAVEAYCTWLTGLGLEVNPAPVRLPSAVDPEELARIPEGAELLEGLIRAGLTHQITRIRQLCDRLSGAAAASGAEGLRLLAEEMKQAALLADIVRIEVIIEILRRKGGT